MASRIAKVVTSGTFSLDGRDFAVDNNVWLAGDDHEVIVIDAAHDAGAILAAVGGRRLSAIVRSIQDRLLDLPPETVVHTGHGEDTTIGAESAQFAR